MKTIETSITIKASKSTIWNILMNTSEYPNWNPFIKSLSGSIQSGAELEVKLQPEGDKEYTFRPSVKSYQPEQEFAWLGHLKMKGLFDGYHYFRLHQNDDGSVEFIHGENFSGLLVKPLLSMIADKTKAGFESMNHAIKSLAESSQIDNK